ncbi:hypothetical protein QP027_09915 [Corynebacterium breve]|uniref:Phenol hydroxylase n=1 Tax=Corynebacterium breve TaxID=3049799 RepID=A0ABY8VD73_9CORY|nr:hypothetical protein [Corynebacterium breve]WIM67409.1 hypothetical protein QP027_09915 [Corynebacterium breve]
MTRTTQDNTRGPAMPGTVPGGSSSAQLEDAADVPDHVNFREGNVEDAWLDRIEEHPEEKTWRTRLADSFSVPINWLKRTWSFVGTTPGRLVAVGVLLTMAIFAAGYAMSQSSANRQDSLDALLTATEPMSNSTHILYTSLSQAETVATSGFVEGGSESASARREYHASIDRAVVAANMVVGNAVYSDPEEMHEIQELVTEIQRQIPLYTGMVETARTNNRMGNPVGATYMSDASAVMRDDLLPRASRLFEITREQVSTEQKRLSLPQLVPISGLVAAIVFLMLSQVWLWRLTRRRFNRGFLAATALMGVAVLWVLASNFATWSAGTRGFEDASGPWDELTTSRILAQESRTDETLALVRRESVASTHSFDTTFYEVSWALDAAENEDNQELIQAARTSLDDWNQAHQKLNIAIEDGNYDEAVRLSTAVNVDANGRPTSAMAYKRLDATLEKLILQSRSTMREYINDGLSATHLVSASVMFLSLLSIMSVWLGIRPRLQEYL